MKLIRLSLFLAALSCCAQTRFYLPSTGTAAVNAPFDTGWSETDNADRRPTSTVKSGSPLIDKTETKLRFPFTQKMVRQFVSLPLNGAQAVIVPGTTWKGTIRVSESAANDNIDHVSAGIRVVSNDGQTLRCGLAVEGWGPRNEWATVLTNRRIESGDVFPVGAYCAGQDNDRVVIELGFVNTTRGSTIFGTMNFGDDQVSDCGDDETGTAACNPFLELTGVTLNFKPGP